MTPIFKRKGRADWCVALEREGVPFSPIYDLSEALQDRQAKFLGIEVEAHHPTMGRFRTVRFPVNFDGKPISDIQAPPTLGEHNNSIRAQAGRIWRARDAADAAE